VIRSPIPICTTPSTSARYTDAPTYQHATLSGAPPPASEGCGAVGQSALKSAAAPPRSGSERAACQICSEPNRTDASA
jgi:hypothetical protein